MFYYAFYHSVMSNGLISGEMPPTHSDYIFKLQKWIITVIIGTRIKVIKNIYTIQWYSKTILENLCIMQNNLYINIDNYQ
jgi:hypothetical protein